MTLDLAHLRAIANASAQADDPCSVEPAVVFAALPQLLAIAEAAMLWRHGMVEVAPGRFVDSDDGSVDMRREPARTALIAAVDAARQAGA